jgi:hypothetical protein
MPPVNIGLLTIDEGSDAPQWGYGPQPEGSQRPKVYPNADAATSALGTALKLPSSVPEGFQLSGVEVHAADAETDSAIAVMVFRKENRTSFELEQSMLGENALGKQDEVTIPASGLRQVSVNGRHAASWTLTLPPPLIRAAPVRVANVAWEDGGNRFLLSSACLSEEELLSVAQSI